jgi:hypothetical protein
VCSKLVEDARALLDALPPSSVRGCTSWKGAPRPSTTAVAGAEYKALTRRVTHIHHCAQVTYLGVDSDSKTAEQVNVGAAREAIELDALVDVLCAELGGVRVRA